MVHNPENDISTYRRIRKAIGVLGFFLPVVLVILSGISFFNTPVQPSISHYYYTNFREIFTGTLCAVGLFLIRYQGHTNPNFFKNDSKLTNIAGVMAFAIAFFPTCTDDCADKVDSLIPLCRDWLGWLHYGFAGVFFLTLSIISINVFTMGQQENKTIPLSALNENNIYRTCGWLMVVFLVLVPVCAKFKCFPNSTLILEALMLFAFGISWLIKGRALGDKGKIGKKLYRETH